MIQRLLLVSACLFFSTSVIAELIAIDDEGMSEVSGKKSIYLDVYTGTTVGSNSGSDISFDPGAAGGGLIAADNIQILNSSRTDVAPVRVQADFAYDAGDPVIALRVSFPEANSSVVIDSLKVAPNQASLASANSMGTVALTGMSGTAEIAVKVRQ